MNLDSNDFDLMGVPARFQQDLGVLDQRRRELQSTVHPDRFASADASARRIAMQWAVRVNEAHARLRDPMKRAAYLCEVNGAAIQAEENTAMPIAFLAQQMAWRDALDDADDDAALKALVTEVSEERALTVRRLATALDDARDFVVGAQLVRALMFIDRLAEDIKQRMSVLSV